LVYGRRRYADGYNTNSFNPVDNNGRAKDGAAIPQDPQKAAEHQQAEQANQVFVKNLLVQAEALFRAGKFREAYQFYTSVTHSTLEEARGEREQALARIREMDELAKQLLRRADDAALARDYVKEIECLSEITKQFHFSGSNLEAAARLSALKSKPEVVGYLLLADAERLDAEQRYAEAMKFYRELTENERYAMTVPGMKAARRIKELEQNPDIMNEIKTTQHQGEITRLLRDAKNFALNKRWHEARSLYEEIRTRFPDTPEAAEAAQRLADLGNLP
jgi:tetratricopeptide (TPR) repeat protein